MIIPNKVPVCLRHRSQERLPLSPPSRTAILPRSLLSIPMDRFFAALAASGFCFSCLIGSDCYFRKGRPKSMEQKVVVLGVVLGVDVFFPGVWNPIGSYMHRPILVL